MSASGTNTDELLTPTPAEGDPAAVVYRRPQPATAPSPSPSGQRSKRKPPHADLESGQKNELLPVSATRKAKEHGHEEEACADEHNLGRMQHVSKTDDKADKAAASARHARRLRSKKSHSASTSSASPSITAAEKISVAAVVVHLLKGNVGPGAMSLPNGFSKTGIYAGPALFIAAALVSIYNMDLLLCCKQIVSPHAPMSFGDVGGKILGPRGKTLIDVFLVGTQLGICCVYFTFVATNIHAVLPEDLQGVVNERQLILGIFPVLLLLSWIRTLRRITPFSGLANFAVFAGISIVFYYSVTYWQHPTHQPQETPVLADWSHLPEFYGTAVYSFEGIGLVLPIQNAMAQPERFRCVLAVCMLVILVLFLFIGEVPTVAFGRIDNGSMTAVLHEYCDGWLVTAANGALAFACTLSFPIQFYPAIDVLERMLRHQGSLMHPVPPAEPPETAQEARRRRKAAMKARHQASHYEHEGGLDYEHEHDLEDVEPLLTPHVHAPLSSAASSVASASSRPSSLFSLQSARYSHSPAASPRLDIALASRRASSPWLESLLCNLSQYECNRTLFRSMLCTSLMIIAICVPDVGLLISLFGSVGSSMLAIVLPPVLYLQAGGRSLSLCSRVSHWGIVVFGVVGMVAGTVQAMGQVIASFN